MDAESHVLLSHVKIVLTPNFQKSLDWASENGTFSNNLRGYDSDFSMVGATSEQSGLRYGWIVSGSTRNQLEERRCDNNVILVCVRYFSDSFHIILFP
jgi:hypothetical protein